MSGVGIPPNDKNPLKRVVIRTQSFECEELTLELRWSGAPASAQIRFKVYA
ncbi:hypothetical protein BX592_104320 [Paraburkholderia rhizosphaerae]|uniref:Uncharacterized protein n=1 Tax=Paraburkholderia rhizosphaerae TaxID=480658 RepID=A0A4R8M102_9BURK|nr:hypothetical protein BX592_104320 [Paraburkholderia rhizosphaerae]